MSTTGNFVTDRYDNPGLYTFSIGATDSTGRAASGVTVGVFVVERIQQQTGSSPGSNSPLQLPQNGWVDNEVVKVCVFANTAVKPKVKLGWQEFRVYRPPPNSHKYDITKFRRLYWRLYPGSSFTIAGGSGKIWLGPYAFTQNDVYSQPSHIQAATTSDGSTWNWSAGTAPEITGIYWPSVDSMGWGRELEGDSVGMDYDEAVDGAPWKVKFTAPKTYEQELERRRDETFFPNFTTP